VGGMNWRFLVQGLLGKKSKIISEKKKKECKKAGNVAQVVKSLELKNPKYCQKKKKKKK
jgi:hypothetical protein